MKAKTNLVFLVSLSLLMLFGCKKDEPEPSVTLPSNLQIEIVQDPDDVGFVTVSAKADKANYYTFVFHDEKDSTFVESNEGVEEYRYTKSGTYTIGVKAHAGASDFIRKNKTVEVLFPADDPDFVNDTSGYSTPLSYPNYTLVWHDEFEGSSLNTADWNYEIGNGANGWGNNELQYYMEENTSVQNGILTIEAKLENKDGFSYTSSRLTTQNKQSFQYGRIDIRAKMPYGQGIWPALWMLGNSFGTGGWPSCGEIDIMEMVGGPGSDNVVHGTAHWDDNGHAQFGNSTTLSTGILADEYHVYTIIWDANSIKWYFDDVQYNELDITPASLSEFHQEFFFIFNVAVGGNWPGSPNANTVFPQKMFVDYVRVFQK